MQRARRILPWLLAAGCVGLLLWRVPLDTLVAAFGAPNAAVLVPGYVVYFGVGFCISCAVTRAALAAASGERPRTLGEVIKLRAIALPLELFHRALGHGSVVMLFRRMWGVPVIVGASTIALGSVGYSLLLSALAAYGLSTKVAQAVSVPVVLAVVTSAVLVYVGALRLRPGPLARLPVAAHLARAGLRGHAQVAGTQLLHIGFLVCGHFWIMRQFGVHVAFYDAVVGVPVVLVVGALPLAPAGIGTTQLAAIAMFAPFVTDATGAALPADQQAAVVIAYTTSMQVLSTACKVLVGAVAARWLPDAALEAVRG